MLESLSEALDVTTGAAHETPGPVTTALRRVPPSCAHPQDSGRPESARYQRHGRGRTLVTKTQRHRKKRRKTRLQRRQNHETHGEENVVAQSGFAMDMAESHDEIGSLRKRNI